ncbi:hypothetical protein GZH53_03100, partial [Flavihumibacter sp. R14]|nr:hypothetical protein [Flavihumibacter soli]
MKLNFYLFVFLLFCGSGASYFYFTSEPSSTAALKKSPVPVIKTGGSSSTFNTQVPPREGAQDPSIQNREYNISYQKGQANYQSPNRKQNLRTVYHADGFELSPLAGGEQNWNLKLALIGISKGGESLQAASNASFHPAGNKLTVKHPGFEMEYENTFKGTRQNFIVSKKPEGSGDLKVLIQPRGELELKTVSETEALFGDEEGVKLGYKDLKVWDAEGKILSAKMEKEGTMLALVVKDEDAVYPVTIDPLASTPDVILAGTQSDDSMGYSVASAGDVNDDGYADVVVGALTYDNGQSDEGAAFIYYGSANGLITSTSDPNGPTIIESNLANSRFGNSVSSADLNKDGFSDVIVGAPQYTNGAGQGYEGAVYIYYGSAAGLSTTPAAILEGNKAGARLGTSVSAAGDLNGDGYPDVVTGAREYANYPPYPAPSEVGEGGVYVFYGTASGISSSPVILELNQIGAQLGGSVSGGADLNDDGYSDLVAGGMRSNGSGGVYIYYGSATGVPASPSVTFASYGASSVSMAGDVNKDGYQDFVAGAPYYTSGAVFVHYGSSSGVSESDSTRLQTSLVSPRIGHSVAAAGDLNDDGYADVVVGAYDYQFDPNGGLLVYYGSEDGILTVPELAVQSSDFNTIGYAVASAGDINKDGASDLITGSPNYVDGLSTKGAAYIYYGEEGLTTDLPYTLSYTADDNINWADGIAQDGEGGTKDINEYTIEIFGADKQDFNKLPGTTMMWKEGVFFGLANNELFKGLTVGPVEYVSEDGFPALVIKGSDQAKNFALKSLKLFSWSGATSYKIAGFNDGTRIGSEIEIEGMNNGDIQTISQSDILPVSSFSNIDEIRIYSDDPFMAIAVNDISLAEAVIGDSNLSALTLSEGTLTPAFTSATLGYTSSVANSVSSITVTPTKSDLNASIQVRVNNGTYQTVASGSPSSALALNTGNNSIDVKATAQDGTSKTYTVTVNRAPSSIATLASLILSSGTVSPVFAPATTSYTASVSNAASTITVTPTTTEPNASITVNGLTVINGNASGAIALNVGANTITTVVTAENGTTTQTYTLTVTRDLVADTTPPAAPLITSPANGGLLNDNTPSYSGTAESSSTVTVIVDGSTIGNTTANGTGNWSFTPVIPLADGPHTLRATATDLAGNTGSGSSTNTFIVDTTPPAAPVALTPANGSKTNDNTPTYSGTAEPLVTVTVIVDGTSIGTSIADVSGAWSFTGTSPLNENIHTIRATTTDAAGNVSSQSNTNTFTVDVTPPAAPVMLTPVNWSVSSDNTPIYSGTAEPSSTVSVMVDGTSIGTTVANGSGAWSFTGSATIADGAYVVKAVATDAAGNISAASNGNGFTIDATVPTLLSIAREDPFATETNANSVIFKVTFSEVISNYSEDDFSISGSTAIISLIEEIGDGVYHVEVSGGDLADYNGEVGLSVISTDNIEDFAGNKLPGTDASGDVETYTLDNTAPVISGVLQGALYNQNKTISFNEGTGLLNAVSFASGNSVSTAGNHTLVVTDNAGNSTSVSFSIDKTAPAKPVNVIATSLDSRVNIAWDSNTETDLRSYRVYARTGSNPAAVIQTLTTPVTSYSHTGLTNGTTYYYTITAVDEAGNESPVSTELTATPKGGQTITFDALDPVTYGVSAFDLSATATSGLAVSFTSSNTSVATVSGTTITIVGAGATTITATQGGSVAYNTAISVPQTLTVNTKALAITATDRSKTYGDAVTFAGTEFTSTGLINGDAVNSIS